LSIAALLVVSSSDIVGPQRVLAQATTIALPPVFAPFPGDPRLEPLPNEPLHLANIEAYTTDQFGNQRVLQMRFPPRVNGQNESDGDKHADLYVLYDAVTHQQIDQPVILEAVPMNAAPGLAVSERKARQFSPIWEMHAVFVDTRTTSGTWGSASTRSRRCSRRRS
jgi:hypothetical protein